MTSDVAPSGVAAIVVPSPAAGRGAGHASGTHQSEPQSKPKPPAPRSAEPHDGAQGTQSPPKSAGSPENPASPSKPIPRSRPTLASLTEQELVAGKYRLVRPLSEGGMGTLWLAHDEALDIDCALKVIRADISEVERDYCGGRLLQEARAAAKLGHPAIVRVSDVGRTQEGEPFLVMELLTGEDLGAVINRRGKVSAPKAAQFLLPIMHALASAHDKGIIHRDVKPENIFLARGEDGTIQPKLIDFGIAKLHTKRNDRLTAAGAVVGTPGYMAPEQARGSESDERADVWAVGVILYELIAGEQPFAGPNFNALMRSIIEDDPKPLASFGVADPELVAIIERGMAKSLRDRWPTMRDFARALAEWLIDQGYESDVCGTSLEVQWLSARPSIVSGDAFDSLMPPARSSTPRSLRSTPSSGRRATPRGTPISVRGLPPMPHPDALEIGGPHSDVAHDPTLPGPTSRAPNDSVRDMHAWSTLPPGVRASDRARDSNPAAAASTAPPKSFSPPHSGSPPPSGAPPQSGHPPASGRASLQPISTPAGPLKAETAPDDAPVVPVLAPHKRSWMVWGLPAAGIAACVAIVVLATSRSDSAVPVQAGGAEHSSSAPARTTAPETTDRATASAPGAASSAPKTPSSAQSASAAGSTTAVPPPATTSGKVGPNDVPTRTAPAVSAPPPPPPPATASASAATKLKQPKF